MLSQRSLEKTGTRKRKKTGTRSAVHVPIFLGTRSTVHVPIFSKWKFYDFKDGK